MPDELDPLAAATALRSLGDGIFSTELDADWAVGEHPHGGYLLALLTKAAMTERALEPLSVSAQFLRAPKIGPVLLRVEELKAGRTVTVVRVSLEQSGRPCVDATISLGDLPAGDPEWAETFAMPVNPPDEAVDLRTSRTGVSFGLGDNCDLRLDPEGAGFLDGRTDAPPRLRMWARPRHSQPDLLFGLVAGDLNMPSVFNLGRISWAPTVQLTALLRARPANGWLRLIVESKTVHGPWFDEDVLVLDSTGRLICQSRQLALSSTG